MPAPPACPDFVPVLSLPQQPVPSRGPRQPGLVPSAPSQLRASSLSDTVFLPRPSSQTHADPRQPVPHLHLEKATRSGDQGTRGRFWGGRRRARRPLAWPFTCL